MKIIDGGVCAAKGFKAGSVRCGIKASRTNDDTAIIFSECECNAAATYTMNRVKAAPVYVTMEHLENGVARAIVANSGNANACAPDGMENARRMAKAAADFLGVDEEDVAVASTGVIGQRIDIECIEEHLSEIVLSDDASEQANRAIMTTDTRTKTAAVEFTVGGKTCRIGGICKGIGIAFDCDIEVNLEEGYALQYNDPAMIDLVNKAVTAAGGKAEFIDKPFSGSEDFSFFGKLTGTPSAFMMVDAGRGENAVSLHNGKIVFNEEVMKHGVTGLAAIAVEYLNR